MCVCVWFKIRRITIIILWYIKRTKMRYAGKAFILVPRKQETFNKWLFVFSFNKLDHCQSLLEMNIIEMLLNLEDSWHLCVSGVWPQKLPLPTWAKHSLGSRLVQSGQKKPRYHPITPYTGQLGAPSLGQLWLTWGPSGLWTPRSLPT